MLIYMKNIILCNLVIDSMVLLIPYTCTDMNLQKRMLLKTQDSINLHLNLVNGVVK